MKTLCIGEILWDIFPDKKVWGGAPANFIFHTGQFGAQATAYSAIGNDSLGQELISTVKQSGVNLQYELNDYPTGHVNITVDGNGIAHYIFNEDCSWDHILFSDELLSLSQSADLICFGSLAQRGQKSRETIFKALSCKRADAKVLFDINLRQNFYSKEIIHNSLEAADFLKLNEEEIVVLKDLLSLDIQEVKERYELELVILTLGEEGSQIISANDSFEHPAAKCNVIDTVGAGDSFTASFIINYLNGVDIKDAQELASRVAAYVCEHKGATVPIPDEFKLINKQS